MSLIKSLITSSLGGTRPGFIRNMEHHCACFFPRSDSLLVTFDHRGSIHARPPRLPWGHGLAEAMGWSQLGTMTKRNDWFRHRDMIRLFRELRDNGFLAGFEEVVFLGASMGGYAACAFSVVHPGARVVALAPQSTLRRDLAPFESRFSGGRQLGNWTGAWHDAAGTIATAANVKLFYDPWFAGDARQADRLQGPQVERYPSPFLGHKLPASLKRLGVLDRVLQGAVRGTLTPLDYAKILRRRREEPEHVQRVLRRAVRTGHGTLARRAAARAGAVPEGGQPAGPAETAPE